MASSDGQKTSARVPEADSSGGPIAAEGRPVAVILAAAGSGERLAAGEPKAMVPVHGDPILAHAIRGLVGEPRVGLIVVAAPPGREAVMLEAATAAASGVPVVALAGGGSRQESVARALAAIPERFSVILVHDAARCLVPVTVISTVVDSVLAGHEAVVPGLPVVDTIRQISPQGLSRTLKRETLRAVQTPQGFSAAVLRRAHLVGEELATDDAGMAEQLGINVSFVAGDPRAFKITTPLDLTLAEALLSGASAELVW